MKKSAGLATELFSNCTKGLQAATTAATAYKYIHTHNSVFFPIVGERKCAERCVDPCRLHVESPRALQHYPGFS